MTERAIVYGTIGCRRLIGCRREGISGDIQSARLTSSSRKAHSCIPEMKQFVSRIDWLFEFLRRIFFFLIFFNDGTLEILQSIDQSARPINFSLNNDLQVTKVNFTIAEII